MIDFENTKQVFTNEEWFDQSQLNYRCLDLLISYYSLTFLNERGSGVFLLGFLYMGYIIPKYDQDLVKEP
jgi:hypothetical protein